MGRTLATFTQLIAQEVSSWSAFRRALRREDQEILDILFQAAKYQVAAGSYVSKVSPFEAMVVAMLIEAYKGNIQLEKRVALLEKEKRKDNAQSQPQIQPKIADKIPHKT